MTTPLSGRAHRNPAVPRVPGLPVVGNLFDLTTVRLRPFLTQAYLEHGPVFQVSALGQPFTVLAGPQANLFASREGHRVLRSQQAWRANDLEFGAQQSMISVDGALHRAYRKVEGRAFAGSAFAARFRTALSVVAEDLAPLRPGDALSVAAWCKATVTEQLARLVVGGRARPYLADLVPFVQTALMVNVTRQWPRVALSSPIYQRSKVRMLQMVDTLIEEHRATPASASGRDPDLIDDLLAAQRGDPKLWGAADLRFAAMGAFVAGMDTAANTLAFVLYRLHHHPDLLPPILDEVDLLFGSGHAEAAALGRLEHLHHFVMETMRLHPIAPGLSRTLSEDVNFGGYLLPAGSAVIIGTTVSHGLESLFWEAGRFDPSRFAAGRAEHRQAGAYAPYGVGAHVCAGSGMAEGLIMLNAAAALRTLDLRANPAYRLREVARPTPSPDGRFVLTVRGVRHPAVSLLA